MRRKGNRFYVMIRTWNDLLQIWVFRRFLITGVVCLGCPPVESRRYAFIGNNGKQNPCTNRLLNKRQYLIGRDYFEWLQSCANQKVLPVVRVELHQFPMIWNRSTYQHVQRIQPITLSRRTTLFSGTEFDRYRFTLERRASLPRVNSLIFHSVIGDVDCSVVDRD